MDLLARKHHRGWRYKWCLLFPILADVLFAGLFRFDSQDPHLLLQKSQEATAVLQGGSWTVALRLCAQSWNHLKFPSKGICIKYLGQNWQAALGSHSGGHCLALKSVICISKWLLLATDLLCPKLGKEMMELHRECQNLSFATVLTLILMPSFKKGKKEIQFFFNLYQYIQSLWFGILTFGHLPSPVWTFVGHIMESPCARDVLLRDVNNSH